MDVFAFLNSVIQHADQLVWVPYFARLGLEEPMVDVKIVGTREYPTFTSACDLNADGQPNDVVLPNTPNAWYCSADGGAWKGALILPAKTLENMWNGDVLGNVSQHPGDVAAAAVVAHEFGHHVADELATQARVGPPAPKGPELLADCLAGLWAYAANQDGYLEPGDVEEAIAAMVALGVNGATSDSHGTGEERRRAFLVGWGAQRVPYVCMAEYWPAMATWLANR